MLVRLIFTLFVHIINNIHFGCFLLLFFLALPSSVHNTQAQILCLPNSIYVLSNFYHFPHNLSLLAPSLPSHMCKEKCTSIVIITIGTLSNIILARSSSIILTKQTKKVFHEFSCLVGGGRERWSEVGKSAFY